VRHITGASLMCEYSLSLPFQRQFQFSLHRYHFFCLGDR
jgi:hypothetical protein